MDLQPLMGKNVALLLLKNQAESTRNSDQMKRLTLLEHIVCVCFNQAKNDYFLHTWLRNIY